MLRNELPSGENAEALMQSAIDALREFQDIQSAVSAPIVTQSGLTVIPVSRISVGILGGGVDIPSRKNAFQNTVGGSVGSGVHVSPLGYLVVSGNDVHLISVKDAGNPADRFSEILDRVPDWVAKIKKDFSGK